MKDLFEMTRRERHGTIVVLVIIALLLAGTVVVRHCHYASPELQQSTIQQFEFESEADSSLLMAPSKPSDAHKSKSKKQSRKRQPKKPKPSKQPRHIDPVPQF